MADDQVVTDVEVYKAGDGWRWRAKAGNGEIVASGESYWNGADLLDVVERMFPGVEPRQVPE